MRLIILPFMVRRVGGWRHPIKMLPSGFHHLIWRGATKNMGIKLKARSYNLVDIKLLAALFATVLVVACGGGGNSGDTSSVVPATPQVAVKNTVAFSSENNAPVTACPNGGITVHSGVDINGDGVLERSEVSNTQYVCNGVNGGKGIGALIAATSESAGNNCSSGGFKISSGSDVNSDGILESAEITSASYICNGVSGSNGANGLNTLVKIVAGVAVNICPSNGNQIQSGLDLNNDGILQSAEVTTTAYVCDGASGATGPTGATGATGTDGLTTLVVTVAEPAGANCSNGGNKTTSGLDLNSDGTLEASEVVSTTYACNGAQGATGATGPTGPTGPMGATGPAGPSGRLNWVSATASTVQAVANTGYIANNGSVGVAIILPDAPAIGDQVQVNGMAAWTLVPNFNQIIVHNMAGTGAVTGGGLSGALGDSILVQYVGNNTFMVTAFIGHITPISNNIFAQYGVLWTPPDFNVTYTWAQGTANCAGASFGGLSGWRMPIVSELLAIDAIGVKGTHGWPNTNGNMWASDPSPDTPGAYAVEAFGFHSSGYQIGTNSIYATCVR